LEPVLSLSRKLEVSRHQLDNGLKILIRHIPNAPVSGCWVIYKVGSRNERPGITGISHWVEHMLFKGGGKLAKGDIARLVSNVGGEFNGFTSKDFTAYYEILPADQIETGLLIESERMMNAAFDPREVESERTVVVSEREGNENDPEFQAVEELNLTAFRFHPYRWSEGGLKQDLLKITRDDLFQHYRQYYVPNNALLVVVGPYQSSKILPKIQQYFDPLQSSGKLPPKPEIVEPVQTGERRVDLHLPSEADYVKIAYHTPAFGSEDVYSLMMLDAVLSGLRLFAFGPGQTSGRSARLYRSLVDKKIATQASSEFWPSMDPSLFSFDLTVWDGVKVERAEHAVLEEVEKIRKHPPGKHELERALAQVKAQYAYTLDGVARQGFVIGIFELVISFETMARLVEKLSQITPDMVSAVAEKYLTEKNRTICRTFGVRNHHDA
jgi:zinc protease